MKFLGFDSVVRQICRNMDDPTAKRYLSVATTLKSVLDQMDLHIFPSIETKELLINDNLTIDLPSNVAVVTKVGTLNSRGAIKIFGLDDNLVSLPDTPDCGCTETTSAAAVCPACTFHGCLINGGYGELYGYRTPQFTNGRWSPDYGNNRIVLGSGSDVVVGAKVLVEFKSDMDSEDKLIQIPKDAYTMLLYRVLQIMTAATSPNLSMGHARMFKIEYDSFKQLNNDVHPQDIVAVFRGAKMSAIKR